MATTRNAKKIQMTKVSKKRHDYTTRTKMASRAAVSLLKAINGHDEHWSHETIRQAIVRQSVVTRDDLLAELPRAAISYAVGKGLLHRSVGEDWFRVTTRARSELNLPAKTGAGQKVVFANLKALPKSEPAFEEPKRMPKPIVMCAAELIANLNRLSGLAEKAAYYKMIIDENEWKPVEIARLVYPDDRKMMGKLWDEVIWLVQATKLEAEYRDAVFGEKISLREGGLLFMVASKDAGPHRRDDAERSEMAPDRRLSRPPHRHRRARHGARRAAMTRPRDHR